MLVGTVPLHPQGLCRPHVVRTELSSAPQAGQGRTGHRTVGVSQWTQRIPIPGRGRQQQRGGASSRARATLHVPMAGTAGRCVHKTPKGHVRKQ